MTDAMRPFAAHPLDAAWSVQHIAVSAATWRSEVQAGVSMMVPRTIVASYFAVASVLSACAGRHHAKLEDEPEIQAISGPVVLEVENHNWSDVVLYIIHDGQTHPF